MVHPLRVLTPGLPRHQCRVLTERIEHVDPSGKKRGLLAELYHSSVARIRVAGGGAGAGGTPVVGPAPDAQATALGLPCGQPQPPKRLPHNAIQRITVEFSEELQKNRDHRRESVVQTGAAPNLGRKPDTPARGRTDVRGCGAFAPSEPLAHARGHLGLRPSIEGLSPPLASPCSPRVLGVGTQDQAVNHPGGCTI